MPTSDTSYYTYNNQSIVTNVSRIQVRGEENLRYIRNDSFAIKDDSVLKFANYNTFIDSYVDGIKKVIEVVRNDTNYYYRLLENGNIVYQIDSSNHGRSEHVVRYDHGVNPRYNISIHLPVIDFETALFDDPEQKNNILSLNEIYSLSSYTGFITNNYVYSFKYKSNHYPSELFMLDKNSINMVKFYYKK